jgi:hypothetical protein
VSLGRWNLGGKDKVRGTYHDCVLGRDGRKESVRVYACMCVSGKRDVRHSMRGGDDDGDDDGRELFGQ